MRGDEEGFGGGHEARLKGEQQMAMESYGELYKIMEMRWRAKVLASGEVDAGIEGGAPVEGKVRGERGGEAYGKEAARGKEGG